MTTQNQKATKSLKPESGTKTFFEHLTELKNRFFLWLVFFIIGSLAGYFIYPTLLIWLVAPLNQPLYYSSPVGGFNTVFTVCLFVGFVFSIPVLFYQVIKFFEPIFGDKSINSYIVVIFISLVLAAIGLEVCYYTVLPGTLNFLSKFGSETLSPLISTDDYFSFVIKYLLSFALLFQMPLAMILIDRIDKLEMRKLLGAFRYVFLGSFVLSAILTPTPDLLNQAIMALPIILLYILSVLVIWVISRVSPHA